ncbi:MAG: FHA domain-containing protein [Pseudomonadales bacterium]|nr:FHA domain-containing protein [Pseudomonadales bacterium]
MFKLQIKDTPQKSIWLVGPYVTVGRAKSNNLVVDVPGVENLHVELDVSGDTIYITDKSGDQSVVVNGEQLQRKRLIKHGDVIMLNTVELELVDPKLHRKPFTSTKSTVKQAPRIAKKPSSAWTIQTDGGSPVQNFVVKKMAVLGRGKDCDISIPGNYLSRRHVEFNVENGLLHVRDLDSSNGTFVNDKRVSVSRLKDGDRLTLDQQSFVVVGPAELEDRTQLRDGKRGGPVVLPAETANDIEIAPDIGTMVLTDTSQIRTTQVPIPCDISIQDSSSTPFQITQPSGHSQVDTVNSVDEPSFRSETSPICGTHIVALDGATPTVATNSVENRKDEPRFFSKLDLSRKHAIYAFAFSILVSGSAVLYLFYSK